MRVELDVGWWLWVFALGFNQTGLEADDVVAQLVVFFLDDLVAFAQAGVVLDLCFQLFDMSLFPLPKGTLL